MAIINKLIKKSRKDSKLLKENENKWQRKWNSKGDFDIVACHTSDRTTNELGSTINKTEIYKRKEIRSSVTEIIKITDYLSFLSRDFYLLSLLMR